MFPMLTVTEMEGTGDKMEPGIYSLRLKCNFINHESTEMMVTQ